VASPHRDYNRTEKEFPKGLPKATLASDCLAVQLKTPAKHHQICVQAYLIRELNNFIGGLRSEWSVKFKEVLEKAFRVKKEMKRIDYQKAPPEVVEIEREIDQLLPTDYSGFHRKQQAFIKRLIKHRESILTFLQYEGVSADNNGSERGIRNVKVKIKV
jgi:hypothetical protein